MKRGRAIELIAAEQFKTLEKQKKVEAVSEYNEYAVEGDPLILAVPKRLLEAAVDHDVSVLDNGQFDAIIKAQLGLELAHITNEYLKAKLIEAGHELDFVEGDYKRLIPCPCCGAQTLSARGDYVGKL